MKTDIGSTNQDCLVGANTESLGTLLMLGVQLQKHDFSNIRAVRGFVEPTPPPDLGKQVGEESSNEWKQRQRSRRSEPGSRKGTARRAWPTHQSISAGKQYGFAATLEEVAATYPLLKAWPSASGCWLLTRSGVIRGVSRKAYILTAILGSPPFFVRSWAFWDNHQWIGPRHTNFNDGSICSYEPTDGTWRPGESLVDLLNLHTLWIARHLHLEMFGFWPGRQVMHFRYERLSELPPNELCGCGSSKSYGDCCRASDIKSSNAAGLIWHMLHLHRCPPSAITAVVTQRADPPSVDSLIPRPEDRRLGRSIVRPWNPGAPEKIKTAALKILAER